MAVDQVWQVLKRIAAIEGPCQHVVLAFLASACRWTCRVRSGRLCLLPGPSGKNELWNLPGIPHFNRGEAQS